MRATVEYGSKNPCIEYRHHEMTISLAIPILMGDSSHVIFEAEDLNYTLLNDLHLLSNECFTIGAICIPVTNDLETKTNQVYEQILDSSAPKNLLRIWNYVPHINLICEDLENYQRFCRGRAKVFASRGIPMPAASAVGTDNDSLVIYFIATNEPVTNHENPEQVPAYEYPSQYGPRSPSFSRASKTGSNMFISGTAAIKGHQSQHPEDLAKQLDSTLNNLKTMNLMLLDGKGSSGGKGFLKETCIYLRHLENLDLLNSALEESNENLSQIRILKADICRRELLLEIETHQSRFVHLCPKKN